MGEVRAQVRRQARTGWRRRIVAVLGVALLGAISVKAWHDTLDDPVLRTHTMPLPGLSAATGAVRVLLMSDLHVAGPDMPPERLARIVAQVNRLRPDIVLIAGDFTSDKFLATRHYPLDQALAPLAGLRSRWGTVAVLGNHDYDRGAEATRAALSHLGIRVLVNQAARVGPLTLGGLDDQHGGDANPPATMRAMRQLGTPYIMLAHEPDSFIRLPSEFPLMLAGHTHCGQIAPPLIGPIITGSAFGQRYACGLAQEHGTALVVTAGLGTSDLPVRFGAPSDVWLITLTPAPVAP